MRSRIFRKASHNKEVVTEQAQATDSEANGQVIELAGYSSCESAENESDNIGCLVQTHAFCPSETTRLHYIMRVRARG